MIRENEEAVMKLLQGIALRGKDGKEYQVKTIYANGEKSTAIAAYREAVQENVEPGVDKIHLPMISFHITSINRFRLAFNGRIYAMWRQDANEIIEKLLQIEKDMEDRVADERRLILGNFIFDEGKNDKEVKVIKVDFDFYFE